MGDGHRRGLARRAGSHVTPFCRVRRARISLSGRDIRQLAPAASGNPRGRPLQSVHRSRDPHNVHNSIQAIIERVWHILIVIHYYNEQAIQQPYDFHAVLTRHSLCNSVMLQHQFSILHQRLLDTAKSPSRYPFRPSLKIHPHTKPPAYAPRAKSITCSRLFGNDPDCLKNTDNTFWSLRRYLSNSGSVSKPVPFHRSFQSLNDPAGVA